MKKLIVSFVLVTLFLSIAGIGMATASKSNNAQAEEFSFPENAVEVAPGVFYLGESIDKGKVVEEYAFVHYAKPATKSKPVWDDTIDKYKFMFGGIKWANTMQYQVNPDGSGLDGDDVMTVLEDSLETWDDAITGDFELFDNTVGTSVKTSVEYDDTNLVMWDDLGSGGTIAVNYFWFYRATKEMVQSDVVFDTPHPKGRGFLRWLNWLVLA